MIYQAVAVDSAEGYRWAEAEFFNLTLDLLCIAGVDGYFKHLNPAWEKTLGFTKAELLAKPFLDFVHPEDREKTLAEVQKLETGVDTLSFENRYRCKDGSYKWLMWTTAPGNAEGLLFATARDISDRKHAEKSQARLAAILEATSDLVGMSDTHGHILYINQAGRRMVGLAADEDLTNLFIPDFHPPSVSEFILDEAIPVAIREGVWSGETSIKHRDGREIPVSQVFMSHQSDNGEVEFFSTIVRDISDRKATEEAFRRTACQLAEAQKVAHVGSWEFDLATQAIIWSEELFRVWGMEPSQTAPTYAEYLQTIHPDDRDMMLEAVGLAITEGKPYELDVRIFCPDGSLRYIGSKGQPVFNPEGKIVKLFGTGLDITERKQAEAALEERARLAAFRADVDRALTQSGSLQDILQNCSQAVVKHLDAAFARIWTLNAEENVLELQASGGMYTHINGAHSRIPVGQFKIGLIAEERKPHLTNSVLDDPRVGNKEWAKREGMIAFAGYPLLVEDRLVGAIAMFARHTLTEATLEALEFAAGEVGLGIKRKQAEAALRQSEAQLRQKARQLEQTLHELRCTQAQLIQTEKMSSLGQLVAGVAHEINNPVNFIYGNLIHADRYTQDLLNLLHLYQKHYVNPPAEIQAEAEEMDLDFIIEDLPQLLNSMKMGADRIRQIVLSLRNFSRLDEAEMKEVDIHEGIDNTLLILQNRLKAKSGYAAIDIVKNYSKLPLVDCYAGQLNQVFMNLINNAIDALENQPSPRTIAIRTELGHSSLVRGTREGAQIHPSVVIRISDNGPGMTEAIQARLFDPFFTTKPVGKGTGLGLSISYQIVVEKHGGVLKCFSEPGKGAEFWVEIPIRQG